MSITGMLGRIATIGTMTDTAENLLRRLDAGEWLRPAEVAALLGISKSTVVRMLDAEPPRLRFRRKPGTGRHRECDPEHVRELLAARRRVHGEQ